MILLFCFQRSHCFYFVILATRISELISETIFDNATEKGIKSRRFVPTDDILETSNKWKSWRRKIEIQMEYFGIQDPKDRRMCLLVHGGNHIMSIDENSAETESKEDDEYESLINKIEKVFIPKKSRLHARFRFNKARIEQGQTIAQYEIELRRLAKMCEFHGYEDEMILDHIILTCGDEKLQDEALSKDWDLTEFMKHAIMKQDVRAQTDEMKSETSSNEFVRSVNKDKIFRSKSSKSK